MTSVPRSIEERLAQAAANGELATPRLYGKPIADIDRPRASGWWADQFVARERSHDRRVATEKQSATARAGFWRCDDVASLRAAVARANDTIARANLNMIDTDRLEHFEVDDIIERWWRLRR